MKIIFSSSGTTPPAGGEHISRRKRSDNGNSNKNSHTRCRRRLARLRRDRARLIRKECVNKPTVRYSCVAHGVSALLRFKRGSLVRNLADDKYVYALGPPPRYERAARRGTSRFRGWNIFSTLAQSTLAASRRRLLITDLNLQWFLELLWKGRRSFLYLCNFVWNYEFRASPEFARGNVW